MMQQIKGLYKISRPLSSFSGVLAVILGGYVAHTGAWLKIALAGLATLLVAAAANAWNDYLDIEIDKVNQPKRPLPSGMISLSLARNFSVITSIVALLIGLAISLEIFIVALFFVLLLYLYSWKLKSTVLIGNATVAITSAFSAVLGGLAAGNVWPSLWLALIIGTAIMGREVLKTLADYEGDLQEQCRTIATVWGKRRARVVFYLLAAATLWVMLLPYLQAVYKPIYVAIVLVGVYPVVFYILLRVTQDRTGPQLEQLSQLMKYDFLIWFVAVWLGAG
ncbi:MAG: geranylgeranylglycerol-phosphate geranylgeranyltransferase [Ardenticatenaceae bacterium]|nr:geranylgeranylglycerol-phosphate geranylgeranyltransferase [Ardenticatenaceae bacterium]